MRISNEILHAYSGRQFGLCPVTVRPCRDGCDQTAQIRYDYVSGGGLVTPVLENGTWFNYSCGRCKTDCSCTELCEVTLPGPVEEIVEVLVDGLPLDPSEYRVDNHRRLVRTSFGPLMLTEWLDLGGGVAVATQSDLPAHGVTFSGGAVVTTGGGLYLPPKAGPIGYVLNTGLPGRAQQRVRFDLEPWAELTLPAGWSVVAIEPLDGDSTVFVLDGADPPEIRGGQFGGWVIVTGPGQAPEFKLPSGPNQIGEDRGGAAVDYVSYIAPGQGGCWPDCQDMTRPATETGTFQVTYLIGRPVPEAGRWNSGLLACELIKACTPGEDGCCRLPSNLQSIAREGISMELAPLGVTADGSTEFGRTGIPEVDMWLAAVNPYKLPGRSRAYSVDRRPPRRTTWPCP